MLSEEFILKTRNQLLEELAYEIHEMRHVISETKVEPENTNFFTLYLKQQKVRRLRHQIHQLNWILGIEPEFDLQHDKFALVKIGEESASN